MKKNNYFTAIVLLLIASLSFAGCSKDDGDPPIGGKSFTMKVNGESWAAYLTTLFTEEHENATDGKFYYVLISGTWATDESYGEVDDAHAEAMGIYVLIPASKFRNPKGTYSIRREEIGGAWALFSTSTNIRDAATYASIDPNSPERSLGTLEITGFEIGIQSVLGQATGVEGYTKLSGNFQMELFPVETNTGKLNITEGKFDLTSGMGFDFF